MQAMEVQIRHWCLCMPVYNLDGQSHLSDIHHSRIKWNWDVYLMSNFQTCIQRIFSCENKKNNNTNYSLFLHTLHTYAYVRACCDNQRHTQVRSIFDRRKRSRKKKTLQANEKCLRKTSKGPKLTIIAPTIEATTLYKCRKS